MSTEPRSLSAALTAAPYDYEAERGWRDVRRVLARRPGNLGDRSHH